MADIETRLFRYFVAVAEELHFANAALRLGISPPALTHQIKKLESLLGTRLLKRKGNTKVVITEAGQRFLPRAREGLRQFEEAAAVARQAGRGELGHLEVGFVASVNSGGLLEKWIGPFKQAHPAIDVGIHRLSPMAQIAGIMRNELDAGFARTPNKYPLGVRGFEIYRQPLVLALPSKHPLARHKEISPAMLAHEPFVSFPTELDLGFSGYTEAVARIGNFIPRVVVRHDDFATLLASVGLGHGIAVAAELLMKTTNAPNVVCRKIAADPPPQTSIAFVYSSGPSPSANLLIRHMRRHALRDGGKGAAPPHNQDRVITPAAPNVDRHPDEVAARSAGLEGCGPRASAVALRGSGLGAEYLRVTGMTQQESRPL
jgi:DNA-binding transcriptional LysR family regulator